MTLRNHKDWEWLPLDVAGQRLGYAHKQSLTFRLRQLRQLGYVVDIGRPPAPYPVGDSSQIGNGKVIVMWPNPKVALLRSDAPPCLLKPKRGKRAKLDAKSNLVFLVETKNAG